jgi:hypothetical protein
MEDDKNKNKKVRRSIRRLGGKATGRKKVGKSDSKAKIDARTVDVPDQPDVEEDLARKADELEKQLMEEMETVAAKTPADAYEEGSSSQAPRPSAQPLPSMPTNLFDA